MGIGRQVSMWIEMLRGQAVHYNRLVLYMRDSELLEAVYKVYDTNYSNIDLGTRCV